MFEGLPEKILELKQNLQKIDAILDMKLAELEFWQTAKRLAIQGDRYCVRHLSLTHSDSPSTFTTTPVKKHPLKKRIGQTLASIEIGTSIGWFYSNCYALASGVIPGVQVLIPFILLIQGILLLTVTWE